MSKKLYGDFERVVIRQIAQWCTRDFLVERTTNYALEELDEQDIKALDRIWRKVDSCAKDLVESLREVPDINDEELEEREGEYYD